MGIGTAIFHPEGARVVHMAARKSRGLSQSIYQVGGNFGQSLGPIFTALIFVQLGQQGLYGFLAVAILGALLLYQVSIRYKKQVSHRELKVKEESKEVDRKGRVSKKAIIAITLLVFLVFARSLYVAGMNNYYQFYLFEDYGISIKSAQKYIFICECIRDYFW